MSIDRIILYIMLIFMTVGIIDKLFLNNKYGYGTKFEEGIMAMGTLAIAMVGIMCLAPLLGSLLRAPVGAIFKIVGADPAMFAGSILAIDMGGLPLSKAMTENPQIIQLSGIYMGAMMGATVVFSIPVSLGLIEESDKPYLAKGMLAGFVSIPFGAFISGLVGGISAGVIIINLIPSIVLALLFAAGLAFIPEKMMNGFNVFAKFITIVIIISLGVAIAKFLGDVQIPFLTKETEDVASGLAVIMDPIGPQLETCGIIAITLSGAFPLVHFITTVFGKPLAQVGKMIGVNDVAAAGIVACLANNIPMFGMMKDMDEKGKVYAVAFSVCASFALGDHLGFTAGVDATAIFPMIVGKILGGVVGIVIAALLVVRAPKKAAA
jgi:ethanolamine transporter